MTNLLIKIYNPTTQKWKSFVMINPVNIPILETIEAGSILSVEVLVEGKKGYKKSLNKQ